MNGEDLDRLYVAHVADLGRRVGTLLEEEGWDAVAVHSGSPVARSRFDDQFWPLRTCPHFQHWLPLAEANCLLIVRPGRKPTLLRPPAAGFWERPAPPESPAFADVVEVVPIESAAAARGLVPPGRVAFVGEDPAWASAWGIAAEAACPATLLAALDALRTVKTAYESACIEEANRRAAAGHEALRRAFASGDCAELDLHLAYLRATRQDDAETPYKNIVALGANASTLHHVAYARQASTPPAESLLLDAGATCRGYASDVTRTWVKGRGAAASAFAGLVAGVEAMQQRLCEKLRLATPYEALHDESHRLVGGVLREAGVVRASVEQAVDAGVTRAFYPHGLGHSLGLQTHDVGCGLRPPRGDNPFLRNTSDVTAGQVLTVEPGIYFIAALLEPLHADPARRQLVDWELVDALTPFGGVRIEDDVLILDRGTRNLTREVLPQGGGLLD